MALEAREDLVLIRAAIDMPGRYYDDARTIVIRTGLDLKDERRHLWHTSWRTPTGATLLATTTTT